MSQFLVMVTLEVPAKSLTEAAEKAADQLALAKGSTVYVIGERNRPGWEGSVEEATTRYAHRRITGLARSTGSSRPV